MAFPNISHNHNWELVFSNIPTVSKESDLRYFHNYIKDFSLPSYSNQNIQSNFQGSIINHPTTDHSNTGLQNITVTFVCAEDLQNYLFFFEWMMDLRYGNYDSKTQILRKQYINVLSLRVFDNEKRDIARIDFSRLFVTDLGNLTLTYQTSDETTFSVTFSYEEINFERIES